MGTHYLSFVISWSIDAEVGNRQRSICIRLEESNINLICRVQFYFYTATTIRRALRYNGPVQQWMQSKHNLYRKRTTTIHPVSIRSSPYNNCRFVQSTWHSLFFIQAIMRTSTRDAKCSVYAQTRIWPAKDSPSSVRMARYSTNGSSVVTGTTMSTAAPVSSTTSKMETRASGATRRWWLM